MLDRSLGLGEAWEALASEAVDERGGGIDLDLFDKTTFAALVDEVRVLLKTDA